MSVSAISSSSYASSSSIQELKQQFLKLGQDLQAGNLSAAQSDFVTLQKDLPQGAPTSSSQSTDPIAQAFNQLSQDLQSGNLAAAKQDYTTIQQDLQAAQQGQGGGCHNGGTKSAGSEVNQLVDQLAQSLQSGDLSAAQQTFSTLQTDLQQIAQAYGLTSQTSSSSSTTGLSVTA